jgi:hypothetical protein
VIVGHAAADNEIQRVELIDPRLGIDAELLRARSIIANQGNGRFGKLRELEDVDDATGETGILVLALQFIVVGANEQLMGTAEQLKRAAGIHIGSQPLEFFCAAATAVIFILIPLLCVLYLNLPLGSESLLLNEDSMILTVCVEALNGFALAWLMGVTFRRRGWRISPEPWGKA